MRGCWLGADTVELIWTVLDSLQRGAQSAGGLLRLNLDCAGWLLAETEGFRNTMLTVAYERDAMDSAMNVARLGKFDSRF
jgi:hypothetical protein